MQKKIIIVGAGIGGLTVAHELCRSGEDYSIHIYEKNNAIGGMARSGVKTRGEAKLPTEYCWRIYGPNYDNLRDILKQIPLKNNPNKTVHDNLIDIRHYLVADQGELLSMNNRVKTVLDIRRAFKNVPFKQKYAVLKKIIYCFLISTKRLNRMDNTSWQDFIDPHRMLCPDLRKYIVDIMGPYLGADARQVNVPSVAKTLETFKLLNKPLSVMNGPTNEAWFDHWQAYLENQGVQFHFNTTITDLVIEGNEVKSILLENNQEMTGDYFYCGLPIDSVATLPSLKNDQLTELAERGHQLMVSIQLYFDKKIELPHQKTAMYIPDSPWQLVIEPQGSLWNTSYSDIADVWSIGLCDHIRPGLLVKKPFIECSHEDIQKEVWNQITTSELGKYLLLEQVQVMDYNVWDTYRFDGQIIRTNEPKFSTNKGTYFLRPNNKSSYTNLYFSTGYTRTETDMFEMESAAESGKRAARLLYRGVKVMPCERPISFAPYRWLDRCFLKLNLYHYFPFAWFILGLPFCFMFILASPIRKMPLYRKIRSHYVF